MTKSDSLLSIKKDLENFIDEESDELLNELYDNIKADTPVDKGRAKNGWRIKDNALYNDVDYVIYLEEGSSKQAPRGFIAGNITRSLNRRK